jgi:transposase
MNIRYRVELEEDERRALEALVAGGSRSVRRVKRAQILLAAAHGQTDEVIATTVQAGTSTVYRTKRCYVAESLEAALSEAPRPGGRRKLTGKEEALWSRRRARRLRRGAPGGRWFCWPTRWWH